MLHLWKTRERVEVWHGNLENLGLWHSPHDKFQRIPHSTWIRQFCFLKIKKYHCINTELIFECACAKTARKSWDLLNRSCWVTLQIHTWRTSPRMEVPLLCTWIFTEADYFPFFSFFRLLICYLYLSMDQWRLYSI